jgi:myo-inositol-1(or 4)-monophosphatase
VGKKGLTRLVYASGQASEGYWSTAQWSSHTSMNQYLGELTFAIVTAVQAGEEIRRLYDSGAAKTYTKSDQSPVTDADLASDAIIRERVANAYPDDAILTEEGTDDTDRLGAKRTWIVDPIDGTQQFVNRTGQFDVLIALVVDGRPVVAVMLQPVTMMFLAAIDGGVALIGDVEADQMEEFHLARPGSNPSLVTTVWLGAPESDRYLERIAQRIGTGKPRTTDTGVIARGHVDPAVEIVARRPDRAMIAAYPSPAHAFIGLPTRGDGTMAWEWDYAAADLIINQAGGRFTDWHGNLFTYNKPVPRNQGGLVIANTPELHERLLVAIEPEIEFVEQSRREK